MSSVKTNVADYLTQIESLTNTNLQILKTLNDSFYTKRNHLFAEIDDTTYVIPSFLSLENKINMLQENFENLIKSPETSEAYFNFDGNTRSIEVRKYSYTPDSIIIPTVNKYSVDNTDVFKDFMTPIPYINLELPSLPNDIVDVNVKKIVPKTDVLKEMFSNLLAYTTKDDNGNDVTNYYNSVNSTYASIYKMLLNYKEDVDYVEYDTVYKLPIRKNIGTATYIIEKVVDDVIDDDLNELITLKLRNDLKNTLDYTNTLTYKLFDETIERPLRVGDELVNYDGTGKVVITEIKPLSNTIIVKVVNGEYLNFLGTESYDTDSENDIHDLSKLRFYSPVDYDADKYVKIPLEEDKYVFIAIAPLNSRMNVQSSWGTGIVVNTYGLTNDLNSIPFKTYYDNNVKNIGDVLYEMTSMVTSPITKLTQEEFEKITKFKPVILENSLKVVQINKHLNNSETVKNIRNAYDQKKHAELELDDVQLKINDINKSLSSISFDDTTGIRSIYTSQLTKLNEQKNELLTVINNAINTISISVNSAEIPVKNAKYRIRGFHIPINDYRQNVIGLIVQYRYKNSSMEIGNATSMTDEDGNTYIYSDWNDLKTFNKKRIVKCVNGTYEYSYEASNENINEPSYNQIDIPISQGESVDVRLKLLYDFGQPYTTVTSDWSNIMNVKFPDELVKDISVVTIIEENNSEAESNKFNNILGTSGVTKHINDSLTDQNITYFHGPDNIASGFYTNERRIIPLKDKLVSLSNEIAEIKSTVFGAIGNCKVHLSVGNNDTLLYSDRNNNITLEPYSNFVNSSNTNDGVYIINDKVVSTIINIRIFNNGENTLRLYSLFPGNRDIILNNTSSARYRVNDYCDSSSKTNGVWFKYQSGLSVDVSRLQSLNQYITFRMNDPWTGQVYYEAGSSVSSSTQNSSAIDFIDSSLPEHSTSMVIYPFVSTKYGLCIDSDDTRSYLSINPGEEIIVPLYCEYFVDQPNTYITKTISFDLRTSLYADPINYTFNVTAKNTTSSTDMQSMINKNSSTDRNTGNSNLEYNSTIK